ncbi:MAG: AAA family ATPase [Myxococcota bacterium]
MAFEKSALVETRTRELQALSDAFEAERLCTLVGPPGSGKSWLAHTYAAGASAAYHARITVSLSDSNAHTLDVIADALGVDLAKCPNETAVGERIGGALRRSDRLLLILDDADAAPQSVADWIAQWFDVAPSLRVLCTCRRPLVGRTIVVGPLLPDDALAVLRAECARLAIDIAGSSDEALRELAAGVDCLPLALRLLAPHLRVSNARELHARLDEPLALLRTRGGEGRRDSLLRVVGESVERLGAPLKRLLALLAHLPDGVCLRQLVDVVEESDGSVSAGLAALSEAGLVEVERAENTRFFMLRTVRASVRALSEAPECDLGERFASSVRASNEDRLNVLRFAYAATLRLKVDGSEAADLAERVVRSLGKEASNRARLAVFQEALDAERYDARIHRGHAACLQAMGQFEEAAAAWERCVAAADDAHLQAEALVNLAVVDDFCGDTASSRNRLAALDDLDGLDDSLRGRRHWAEAHAYRREGKTDPAERALAAALRAYGSAGALADIARVRYELGVIGLFRGDVEQAREAFARGEADAVQADHGLHAHLNRYGRAAALQALGSLAEARELYRVSADWFDAHGEGVPACSARYYLATCFLEEGSAEDALSVLHVRGEHLASLPDEAPGGLGWPIHVDECGAVRFIVLDGPEADGVLERAGAEWRLRCSEHCEHFFGGPFALRLRESELRINGNAIAEVRPDTPAGAWRGWWFRHGRLRAVEQTASPVHACGRGLSMVRSQRLFDAPRTRDAEERQRFPEVEGPNVRIGCLRTRCESPQGLSVLVDRLPFALLGTESSTGGQRMSDSVIRASGLVFRYGMPTELDGIIEHVLREDRIVLRADWLLLDENDLDGDGDRNELVVQATQIEFERAECESLPPFGEER